MNKLNTIKEEAREKFQDSLIWKVITKHLTPETVQFIEIYRDDLVDSTAKAVIEMGVEAIEGLQSPGVVDYNIALKDSQTALKELLTNDKED